MERCATCHETLGGLTSRYSVSDFLLDGPIVLCRNCLKAWPDEQKCRAIAAIFEGAEPVESFRIHATRMDDEQIQTFPVHFVGDLIFLDKGVVFVQLTHFKASFFGPWVSGVKQLFAGKRAVDLAQQGRDTQLLEYFEKAPRVVFFPRAKIRRISASAGGMMVERRVDIQIGKTCVSLCPFDKKQTPKGLPNWINEYWNGKPDFA